MHMLSRGINNASELFVILGCSIARDAPACARTPGHNHSSLAGLDAWQDAWRALQHTYSCLHNPMKVHH